MSLDIVLFPWQRCLLFFRTFFALRQLGKLTAYEIYKVWGEASGLQRGKPPAPTQALLSYSTILNKSARILIVGLDKKITGKSTHRCAIFTWLTGLTGVTWVTEIYWNSEKKSITDWVTTWNKEMLAHLKTKTINCFISFIFSFFMLRWCFECEFLRIGK